MIRFSSKYMGFSMPQSTRLPFSLKSNRHRHALVYWFSTVKRLAPQNPDLLTSPTRSNNTIIFNFMASFPLMGYSISPARSLLLGYSILLARLGSMVFLNLATINRSDIMVYFAEKDRSMPSIILQSRHLLIKPNAFGLDILRHRAL